MGLGKGYPLGVLKRSANYHDKQALKPIIAEAVAGRSELMRVTGAKYRAMHTLPWRGYSALANDINHEALEIQLAVMEPISADDPCDALQNWIDAMNETDSLADIKHPDTAAALSRENKARAAYLAWAKGQSND